MNLNERDRRLLRELYRRGWTITADLRDAFFPADTKGNNTRKRLRELKFAGLVRQKLVSVGPRWDRSESGAWRLTMDAVQLLEAPPEAAEAESCPDGGAR